MHLIYQKLPNQVIVPFFAQLYYWGIEQVIVDNMNHPMIVKRSDVMPEMDQKKDEDTYVYNNSCATMMFENLMDKCGHTLPFPSMTRNIVHAICSGEAVPCVNWESICL